MFRGISRWIGASRLRKASVAGGVGLLACAGLMGLGRGEGLFGNYVVFAYNDLGMHCMQSDFSQMMVLPPFNTLHAQVIRRGGEPSIQSSAVVTYELPTNTHSSDKTNFWQYAPALLGANVPPDIGLAGFGLRGTMTYDSTRRDYVATGIPVTPIDDDGKENPFPLAIVTAWRNGAVVAQTQAVVPVSWEMSCNICHNDPSQSTASNILKAHDRLHGTNLYSSQPVMCASCHADNALGTPGTPGVPNLSSAMHTAHASRVEGIPLANACYACHPGIRTNCQRDVHAANGVTCTDCHGSMADVGNPARNPWVEEPRCGGCHTRQGFEFEQPNTLFRNSVGHSGVQCMSCHGSPHAIGPAITEKDNLQANRLQGHSGPINTCTVCHTSTPSEAFFHRVGD